MNAIKRYRWLLVEFLAATLVALALLWIIWPRFRAAQQINRIKQRQAELQDSVNRLTEQGAVLKNIKSIFDLVGIENYGDWGEFKSLPIYYLHISNDNSITVPFQSSTDRTKLWHFVEVTDMNLINTNLDYLAGALRQNGLRYVWVAIEPVYDGKVVEPVQTPTFEKKFFTEYQVYPFKLNKPHALPSFSTTVKDMAEDLPVSEQPLDAIHQGLQKVTYDTSNGLNSSGYLVAWSASEIDEASRNIKLPSVRHRTYGSCGVSIMIVEKTELVRSATETADGS